MVFILECLYNKQKTFFTSLLLKPFQTVSKPLYSIQTFNYSILHEVTITTLTSILNEQNVHHVCLLVGMPGMVLVANSQAPCVYSISF